MRSLHSLRAARRPHPAPKASFQHIRHFHPTRPSPFINEALETASAFVHGVHSVSGLPWVASIPLTALIVRTTVALPLLIVSKIHGRREQEYAPQLQSYIQYYRKRALDVPRDSPPLLPHVAQHEVMKKVAKQREVLRKRWNVFKYWKPLNLLQIPIWISLMESIRAMSGVNNGFAPWLLSLVEPRSALEGDIESRPLRFMFEESLSTEGALWFPDLLAGDSTGILSALLTFSVIFNIRYGWKAESLKEISARRKFDMYKGLCLQGLRGGLQLLALYIGFSSWLHAMPPALMIYWITSANVSTFQTFTLNNFMFAKPPLKLWKKLYVGHTRLAPPKLHPPRK